MTIADTIQLALRNLSQSKLRTALTTLGVAIGIASLAGMVSLGVGLEDQIVGRFLASGVFDSITVVPNAAFGRGGRGGGRGPFGGGGRGLGRESGSGGAAAAGPHPDLDDGAVSTIAALPQVKAVYPNVRIPVQVKLDQASEGAIAIGVPLSARGEGAFQSMTAGTFFANERDAACLLSLDMAKRLSVQNAAALVGRDLTVSYASAPAADPFGLSGVQQVDVSCRVLGIVERDPGLGGPGGISGVMLPLAKALEIDQSRRTYTSLTVRTTRPDATQDVEDRVKALGFNAVSVNDALQGAKRAFLILDIVLSLIGSIALAVSSLGIVNTMVMSILERTREIGVMKAVGGSDGDIRRIFLVEASTIGVLGGVGGVALGWVVGRVINFGANLYIQSQGGTPGNLFSLPLWLIGGAIGFSWIVSLIAGSYPATRAARLDPIQALRHD